MNTHYAATVPQVACKQPNRGRTVHPKIALAEGLVQGVMSLQDDARLFVTTVKAERAIASARNHIMHEFLRGEITRDVLREHSETIDGAERKLQRHLCERVNRLKGKIIPEMMDCARMADVQALSA